MVKYVETPFFVFNSRFDAWQMDNDLQVPCHAGDPTHTHCNTTEQAAIIQYGALGLCVEHCCVEHWRWKLMKAAD
jgi:hypothetical protein